MSNYFSAPELSAMCLDSLKGTRQSIEYRAKKENWPFEYVKGKARGGKLKMFLLDGLPSKIQKEIKEKQLKELMASVPISEVIAKKKPAKKCQQLGLIPIEEALRELTQRQRDVANARCGLVAYVLEIHNTESFKMGIKKSAFYVAEQIAAGTFPQENMYLVDMANDRTGAKQKGVSGITLYRWTQAFMSTENSLERLRLLAPQKTRKKTQLQDVNWLGDFLNYYCHPNKPTITMAMRAMAIDYAARNKEMPSYDQVSYTLKNVPEYVKQRGRKTGSAYKQHLPYVRRDWTVLKPNEVWIGDGHSFKAKVQHPISGNPAVLEFTAIIDGCSAAIMGWSVALAENTLAVADALRHAMQNNGLPYAYYSDNGGGQTGKKIDHDITGLLPRLGIDHTTGIAGNPQGRGRIERMWQSTVIPLAKTYPTYQGKDADKETLRKVNNSINSVIKAEQTGKQLTVKQVKTKYKLPTFSQFLSDLASVVEQYNEHHEHRSLPKNPETNKHFTPMQYYRWRIQQDGLEQQRLSELELDYLFRPEDIRTVSARAEISWINNVYFHTDLLDFAGQKVRISFDIHHSESIIVKQMDGTLICKAICNGNKRDAFPMSYREHITEQRLKRKVKSAEDKIMLAKMEANPALENTTPDFEIFSGQIPKQTTKEPRKNIKDFAWEDDDVEDVQFKTA